MKKMVFFLVFLFFVLCVSPCASAVDAIHPIDSAGPNNEFLGYWTTWTNSTGAVWIRIAKPIYNDGETNLILDSGSAEIEGSDGELLDTVSRIEAYPQILAPGEVGWYYTSTIVHSDEAVENVVVRTKVKETDIPCIRFQFSDAKFKYDKYSKLHILGRVSNNLNIEINPLQRVEVVAFLYDSNGFLLAELTKWLKDGVPAGERIGVKLTELGQLPGLDESIVASNVIFAYPTQYDMLHY